MAFRRSPPTAIGVSALTLGSPSTARWSGAPGARCAAGPVNAVTKSSRGRGFVPPARSSLRLLGR